MKKISTLLCFLIFITGIAVGQNAALTGKLVDSRNLPVPFVNVALLKAVDSSFAAGSLTDSSGKFSLAAPEPGKYFLRFTAIAYREARTAAFEVTASGLSRDFGLTSLESQAKNLQNVTVVSLRPTIIQKADRMVVNVEGTAMAAGNNAYSVLANAPGVFIDGEGNIQLNGRSGVTVMIDGRPTRLSARDLRNLLQSMPAENIKDIEIITNPSAKYDAEGTSGILNINLKKNTQQGMNGSLYTSYQNNFRHQYTMTGGGNINFKTGKWNSFINLDLTRRTGGRDATFTRIFYSPGKTTYFDQVATGNYISKGPPAIRIGTDYTMNNRHSIGGMFYYANSGGGEEFLTDTYIGNAPKTPDQHIAANNYNHNRYINLTTNLHYNFKIDTLGTTLSTDIDYIKITNRGHADFLNYFDDLTTNQRTADILYTSTNSGYDIYSGKIDFSLPLRKTQKLEAGIKAARVISDNDFRFYFNNTGLVMDPLRTNHFYYRESIYAGYLNWNRVISKKITVQAGLRVEQTQSTGRSLTTGQITHRRYFDLFPSVFIQQTVNENYGINYNYSRRLTRPNYGNLNPYKSYRDPYTWTEGNPYLRPQYTHSFSITQTFKKIYILSLSYLLTHDVISEIPVLNVADATTIYTSGNVNDGHSLSLGLIVPQKLTRKWDTKNSVLLGYNKFSLVSNNSTLVNDQLLFAFQSIHTILLPKDFRLEFNFVFRGPSASGLYHQASTHKVDIAFKKSFFKKKVDLTLGCSDLFKGTRYIWTTDIDGNVNDFNQYFRFRNVNLALRYNFSKGQKVNVKQRTTVEEANRAN
ncbi:MAG TPA: outer membrane beta-barrel protein [Chitinophagaceae bacterium]|jgi:hypothetical protein|nr:outer membrane beta-barrel protein [Chitinophagaceae bacterium]